MYKKKMLYQIPTKYLIIDYLIQIKNLLTPFKSWTQKKSATNSIGYEVAPTSPTACCWCISGAIAKVTWNANDKVLLYNTIHQEIMIDVREEMRSAAYVAQFNDNHSHENVLKLIDKTITRLQKEI